MCKWVNKCSHVNASCEKAQECSYSPAVLRIPDDALAELNESIGHCGSLVRARDIPRPCHLKEFSKNQESGQYILADDVLNLRISLETMSVDQFLAAM